LEKSIEGVGSKKLVEEVVGCLCRVVCKGKGGSPHRRAYNGSGGASGLGALNRHVMTRTSSLGEPVELRADFWQRFGQVKVDLRRHLGKDRCAKVFWSVWKGTGEVKIAFERPPPICEKLTWHT
jgi:hypothetical protein